MKNVKLGVEVVAAHNLKLQNGQASCGAFVELHLDHQKIRTTVKENALDPVWNESFYFNVYLPAGNLSNLTLDARIYHKHNANISTKSFLGKVTCITGASFIPYSEAVVLHYPLEKPGIFSRVTGRLALKLFIGDEPSIKNSNPLPTLESYSSLPSLESSPKNLLPRQGRISQQPVRYGLHGMQPEPLRAPQTVQMYWGSSSQPLEYVLVNDLIEPMQFLFVRVVKARDLPVEDDATTWSLDPFAQVRVGNFQGVTQHVEKTRHPEWNKVFVIARQRIQTNVLEVVVKDKDIIKDFFVGLVRLNLNKVRTRVPPDTSLAPEWHRLVDRNDEMKKNNNGELMLAVWIGTQADEAFSDAEKLPFRYD